MKDQLPSANQPVCVTSVRLLRRQVREVPDVSPVAPQSFTE
jgi:hypothetical protein